MESTSSASHPDLSQNGSYDFQLCSICCVETGFGLLLPKRTKCKFCFRVICAGCSKERALNPVTQKEQRICTECRSHMSQQFTAPSKTPKSIGFDLHSQNDISRQSGCGEDIASPGRDNYNSKESVSAGEELARERVKTDILSREKEELKKMLLKEQKQRAKEARKLAKALKQLSAIKEKLGKVVSALPEAI